MKFSQMLVVFLFAVAFIPACSFFSDKIKENPYGIEAYSQEKVDSIIKNHPYTIIHAWRLSCGACQNTLINHVYPYLANKPDSIGFISITSTNYKQVIRFMEMNNCEVPSFFFADTVTDKNKFAFYHYLFLSIFKDYEPTYHAEADLTIVCNNKKEILNKSIGAIVIDLSTGDTIPGMHYDSFERCISHFEKIISK